MRNATFPPVIQGADANQSMGLLCFALFCCENFAPFVGSAFFAHAVRAHQVATFGANHQFGGYQPLVLAAVATLVARNFVFW
jgi:hypothetical protein